MTAEVAIINRNAVALAADSAVTIGSQKIYNSALKLFSLSKVAPVGVMIYGNASLIDVPWETIIKIFRESLGDKRYDSLQEYADEFFEFVRTTNNFFPESSQKAWVQRNIRGYYEFILKLLIEDIQEVIKLKGKIEESETQVVFEECVKKRHEELNEMGLVTKITKTDEKDIRKKYQPIAKDLIKEVFQGLTPTRTIVSRLYDIAAFIHSRVVFSESTSGLVIAGYGEKEIYPSVLCHEIEGVVENKLKYKYVKDKSQTIGQGAECSIIPFAQDDMVASFMHGLNSSIQIFLVDYLNQMNERIPDLLNPDSLSGTDEEKAQIIDSLKNDVSQLLQKFLAQLQQHTQAEHAGPIMQMVCALPKDELAAMAESLVNLTAFKRRMTKSLETVGGPIDVAVISKGDGLVWVKRKHYFPSELNQHFFANYFRGMFNEPVKS